MGDDRYSTLPKWAQKELQRLQRDIKSAEDSIALLQGSVASRVYVRGWNGPDRPIGDTETVSFQLFKGCELDIRLCDDENGSVRVMSREGVLVISPVSSNVISLQAVKR
jgi:hypothetical protein